MTAAYVLLLTFAIGNSQADYRKLTCKDWACVERIVDHAYRSRALSRLRVFKDQPTSLNFGEATVFPAVLDLRFQ